MNSKKYSLVKHLSRSLSLWVGGFWLFTSLGVALYVHNEISDRFDESLVESARLLLDIAVHEVDEIAAIVPQFKPQAAEVPDSQSIKVNNVYLVYQFLDEKGNIIFLSEAAPKTPLSNDLQLGFSERNDWRTYTLRHPTRKYLIVVADTHSNRYKGFIDTMSVLMVILLALLPLILFAVRRVTATELRAVQSIAHEISARNGVNLSPIAVTDMSMELTEISDSANHLLARLDDALKTERALAANAAHELRTPLASARMSLSAAQGYAMSEEALKATQLAVSSLDTLNRRAEKLLQLSRAEASATLSQDAVDLGVLANAVVDEFAQTSIAARQIKLSVPDGAAVIALGDFDSLAIALRNLIENSLKYAPQSEVLVSVSNPPSIAVSDSGAGINAEDMVRLRQRHVRLRSNLSGYGLGLYIVRNIMDRQGGGLELYSPPKGRTQGLEAVMTFGTIAL
jgi:two-component system, OmpR family, sensor kinase